jgi:hypothetical protein
MYFYDIVECKSLTKLIFLFNKCKHEILNLKNEIADKKI